MSSNQTEKVRAHVCASVCVCVCARESEADTKQTLDKASEGAAISSAEPLECVCVTAAKCVR